MHQAAVPLSPTNPGSKQDRSWPGAGRLCAVPPELDPPIPQAASAQPPDNRGQSDSPVVAEWAPGREDFGCRWVLHALGQDTDHGVSLSVEVDGAAQHGPISTETLLPESVAEHGHGVVPRLTFAILIDATQQRVGTQHLKKTSGRQCRLHMKCFAGSSQTHGGVSADGQVGKGAALLFPVLVISQGNLLVIAAAATMLFQPRRPRG